MSERCMSAEQDHYSQSLAARDVKFGLDTGPIATNMAGVQRRKRNMVEDLVKVHLGRYEDSGVELIMGEGRFIAPKTVAVRLKDGGERVLAGDRVVFEPWDAREFYRRPWIV